MSFQHTPMQRALDRERVLEFEEEVQTMLHRLSQLKEELSQVSRHRREWLDNISQTHSSGSGVYEEKLALIQAQAELSKLNLKLDTLRLDAQHEIQTLHMLIEATKPLGEEESEEDREAEMRVLARENAEQLKEAMQVSLDFRVNLTNYMHDCELALQSLRVQTESEQRTQQEEWRRNIQTFQMNMVDSMKNTKSSYQTIVREYLVLRHNAQVAQALLVRSQQESAAARQELQRCLDHIESEAAKHRHQSSAIAQAQWNVRTRELRAQVVEKEKLLEETTQRVQALRARKSLDIAQLQQQIRVYEARCAKREKQRETDVQAVMHELRFLRQSVRSVQERISTLHMSSGTLTEEAQIAIIDLMRKKLSTLAKEMDKIES